MLSSVDTSIDRGEYLGKLCSDLGLSCLVSKMV